MDGDIVSDRFYECGKTDVVPWEDLSIGSSWDECFGHVPLVLNKIRRFFTSAGAF